MTENLYYPIIVVGAGHAGCEAALAASRMGVQTLLVTMNLSTVALMPCNPSIGGPGKGHLVREIGALGGEMARAIDDTLIQIKWLNTSRGPAVQARRAQADKQRYQNRMLRLLFSTPNLSVRQGTVVDLKTESDRITGIRLETGIEISCDRLIVSTGTYLNSRIIVGPKSWQGGPHNQRSAEALSESLRAAGIPLRRLQTATPPRVHAGSLHFDKMQEMSGEIDTGGFLWENRSKKYDRQKSCWLTFTNQDTINAVRRNLKNSPLVLANITNVGPKHCPSIDRKVLKFPNITRHQIFVEPEGDDTPEMYLQGLTTSMPPESQREIINNVPGLESAKILRYGYAIEYDALDVGILKKTMASRKISGLYTAGQINGTSGYEEAAAQGLVAGINAANSFLGRPDFVPSRTQGYLGVLVDDLSTWDHPEPYRITPHHAEFRLSLREDTAEVRFIKDGFSLGLVKQDRFEAIDSWISRIQFELENLENSKINPRQELLKFLADSGTGGLKKQVSLAEILQRPRIGYATLGKLVGDGFVPNLSAEDEIRILENEIKYKGYADREKERMIQTRILELVQLPLSELPHSFQILSPELRRVLLEKKFDDLGQLVRKLPIKREELVIILSYSKNIVKFEEKV